MPRFESISDLKSNLFLGNHNSTFYGIKKGMSRQNIEVVGIQYYAVGD